MAKTKFEEGAEILDRNRAEVYKFLSSVFRDEIDKKLLESLKKTEFIEGLQRIFGCVAREMGQGFQRLINYSKELDVEKEYRELRYEYADLFLNAGKTPVFPYESVYATGLPLVNQKPVFEVKEMFREAGVHKKDDYPEPEDHIAVEFEFMRYLCENHKFDLQIKFIEEHLSWTKEFFQDLKKYSNSEFYKAIAEIAEGFISLEKDIAESYKKSEMPEECVEPLDVFGGFGGVLSLLEVDADYYTIEEGVREPEGKKEIASHCYMCGSLCGIRITVEDGVITGIKGLVGDPKGDGMICPKGSSAYQHTYSAYRLKAPLIREGDRFRKATWDEALDYFVENLKKLNPHEVGWLRGNDWNRWLTEAIIDAYGAHRVGHRPMCDNAIRMANEHNLNDKRPWIDYRESDYIILWGCNELATSYGRRKVRYLREALKRGAKLVVIDTRRTETAELAHEWIAPKPGTDAAIAMAMCYVIVKNELYNKEFVENWTYGFEDFKKRLLGEEDGIPRTPEWAEKISGVPAETIERLALEFANAEHPAVMIWTGIAQTPAGFYGTQAIMALNGLMGTWDAPGGPQLPFKRKLGSAWGKSPKPPKNSPKEKLDKVRMWAGWVPAYFPKDVEEGRIKALVSYWGEPVLSWTNQQAVVDAIKKLEFVATIDAFMSNIALLSHVVLPECTFLEMDDIRTDWLYEAFISGFFRAIEPMYESKPTFWIYTELGKRLGFEEYLPWDDIEDAFKNMLGDEWSLEELKKKGYIITDKAEHYKYKKWGSFNPPEGYSSSGTTKTGKYNFKNPVAEEKGIDPLPDYKSIEEEYPELTPDENYPLILQNFRVLHHEHSSTFNIPKLMKSQGKNPLWINPLDARERGIRNGDKVIVESPWGKAETEAFVTWNIRQGVVAAAGGFGHWRGLEADPRFPYGGFNVAALMAPNLPDKYGGNPLLKYIKVNVKKIEDS